MLAENSASFINECQVSTLGLSLSVHTSVIPASVCPGWSEKRRDDGTDDKTPGGQYAIWATVPSLSTCDGHTTAHWPVALFK